jgi:hypothetical protein
MSSYYDPENNTALTSTISGRQIKLKLYDKYGFFSDSIILEALVLEFYSIIFSDSSDTRRGGVMPGLHECPHCHYRFEDKQSLDQHLDKGCTEAP